MIATEIVGAKDVALAEERQILGRRRVGCVGIDA